MFQFKNSIESLYVAMNIEKYLSKRYLLSICGKAFGYTSYFLSRISVRVATLWKEVTLTVDCVLSVVDIVDAENDVYSWNFVSIFYLT